MPWFGQGGKKSKLPATTELQNLKNKQIESLRKGNLNVIETIRDVEYRVTFQAAGSSFTLIVTLPPQFPQEKPVVTIEPSVRHPWVDSQMKVTGCPNVNNFSVHSSLCTAVQSLIEEMMSRPPAIVSRTPCSPTRGSYPSLFPITTNIFNMYPSMPATSQSAMSTETTTTESSQSHNSSTSNGGIPDFSQADIFSTFPELKDKSHMELLELLEEEDKILEFIQKMPQVQQIAEEREKISCKCTQLAKENLDQKPVIEGMKQSVREKRAEFEGLREGFERNQERQMSMMDQFHPTVIQNNLKVAVLEAEEESDKIVEDYLDKKLTTEEFQQQFLDKRTVIWFCDRCEPRPDTVSLQKGERREDEPHS